jgi:predicted double-glycine peptidase
MEVLAFFCILIAFLGTRYPMTDLPEDNLTSYIKTPGMEHLELNHGVKPLSEFTFQNIVKQKYDYSCGSAALATILNYYLNENFNEQQVIQGLMDYGEVEKIQERRAFSLLDMKQFVEVLGYKGGGFRADFNDLKALDKPAIVPIEFMGYKHFVVYRGVYGDHVFLADPYLGNTSYTISRFKEMWTQGFVFLISKEDLRFNAMALEEEDLRIISYDVARHALTGPVTPETVTNQRDFIESLGGQQFKTVNIR